MLLPYIIKHAYATYDYAGSKVRDYYPTPSDKPIVRKSSTGEQAKSIGLPKKQQDFTNAEIPKRGVNTDAGPWYSMLEFVHSFNPTISGTGSGRQYWNHKQNPYQV